MTNPIQPILDELLSCLCATVATLTNAPQQCCFRDGTEVPADILPEDVCCKGLAWVRPGDMIPAGQSFPEQDTAAGGCIAGAWALEVELGIFRCSGATDCTGWTAQTKQSLEDRWALIQTLCCFDKRMKSKFPALGWLPTSGSPLEIQGKCGGAVQNLIIQVPGACCV